jgi:hypothetical protein
MVQMRSDLARQQELMNASFAAKREGAVTFHKSPLYERLEDLHAKERRKSFKLPWKSCLFLIGILYFFYGGGQEDLQESLKEAVIAEIAGNPQIQSLNIDGLPPEDHVQNLLQKVPQDEMATVSITLNGQTIMKDISVSEIENLQKTQF